MNDDEREKVDIAGGSAFAMAVELRRLCNQKTICPADLAVAVGHLAVVMKNLESLIAKGETP